MSIVRALAVLGAAGSGYMKGQQIARDRKRQDEDDAFKREQRDRTRAGWADQDEQRERDRNLEQGLRADAAPVTAAPAGMRDATADDRDVGMPDGPSFGIKVGNQVVPDQAAADASMAEQNTIPAVMRRQAKTLQGAGKADQADSRLQRAEALEKEGVLDALRGIRGAMPAFDGMTPGSEVQFDIPDDVATKFNSVGKVKIPKDAVARGRMREVDGVMLPDFSIVSKDGSKVYVKSGAEMEGAIGMTLAQRRTAALEGQKAKDAKADKEADNKRGDRELDIREREAPRMAALRTGGGGGRAGGTDQPAPMESPEATFDFKAAIKFADDRVAEENKARADGQQPPMTAQEMARRADEIVQARFKQHADNFAFRIVQRELAAAEADPAAYQAAWAKATRAIPAETLTKLGFKPPAAPAVPTASPSAASAPAAAMPTATMSSAAAPPRNDATSRMVGEQQQAVVAAHQKIQEARAMLAAAAKSGDPKALKLYADAMQAAVTQRDRIAAEKLGNGAARFIATLPE